MFKKPTPSTNEEPPPAYSPRDNLQQKQITDLQSQIVRLISKNSDLQLLNVKLKSENSNLEKNIDKAYAKNDHLSVINTNKSSEYNRMLSKCEFLREELETKTDRVKELEKRIYELIHTISNKNKEIEELKLTLGVKSDCDGDGDGDGDGNSDSDSDSDSDI